MNNVVLVGFMGSGKSTVGPILARLLDRPFVDLDDEIVKEAGRPIAARLIGTDGRPVGEVLVSDHPNYLVCVLDDAPAGARYAVAVTSRGGALTDVGTFTSEHLGWAWTADLPVDGSTVRRVIIRDGTGQVRATAALPG